MKIALISFWDNGQQMQLLAEALRKYTEHDALHLNLCKTSLDYDTDLWTGDFKTLAGLFELKTLFHDFDDFFIISELLPDSSYPAVDFKEILKRLGFYQKLNRHNLLLRTAGEISRTDPGFYLYCRIKKGWIYTGGYHDFDLAMKLGFVAPTRNICPIDKIPEPKTDQDKIRICFTPTKKNKGIKEFEKIIEQIKKEYDNIEEMTIRNTTWKETMELKSTCNITFDQFSHQIPTMTYANAAIEGMWLKQAVISRIDLWTQMLFPDLPIINVKNEDELYNALKDLIENRHKIEEIGKKGKEFIETYHHPKVVVEQWDTLMRFVKGEK